MEKKETLQTEFNRVLNESRRGIVEKLNSFGGDPESLNEEQRQEIILMETKRRKALEKMERENNRSMQETTRWLNRVLDQKISGPIASIAKAKGFDLILIQPRSEVAYLRAGVDITELVLKKIGVDGSTPNNSAVPASEPENDSGDVNNKGL